MDIDLKSLISKAIETFTKDDKAKKAFESDPISAVKNLLGETLSNETITKIIDAVKAALAGNDVTEKASGIVDKIKGLFGK